MNKEVKVFAAQEVWDEDFLKYNHEYKKLVNYNDAIVKLIYAKIPRVAAGEDKNYFEIGCYMARFMYHFGKMGYTLNGIDQSPDMGEKFTQYLQEEGFKIGKIKIENVFKLHVKEKYDIVASFGFIEHFSNFTELIDLHFEMTSENGYVMIAVPNLRGAIQYCLHWLIDKKHLDIHNMEALKPSAWRNHIKNRNFEIVFDGYIGGFNFWVGNQKRNLFQKAFLKFIFQPWVINSLRRIKKSSAFYSPYFCMILKKK